MTGSIPLLRPPPEEVPATAPGDRTATFATGISALLNHRLPGRGHTGIDPWNGRRHQPSWPAAPASPST